ncbi:RNA-binding protein [Phanerochaete sordida]|uniref:RNA-binding protein n=1 Tax=Phanerochaete sordida TaxID=48140 RepID=A0A9P3G0V6_9APHY|nr:RNA-binding protein [Phanerochaete sordida]
MPPKKAQKMSLNEFLGDSALGSWADEMDSLPSAPSGRVDDDRSRMGGGRRDDFMSSRPDRGPPSNVLPTEPPYIAFVGNLAFDLTEADIEDFFKGHETKSIKIIKDREDKPKGFGYVEFATVDGLKAALDMFGSTLAGRSVRINVAEPPKERSGFGGGSGGGFDDEKFASPWRRDGPLPDRGAPDRGGSRPRFEGASSREPLPPSMADGASEWRSSRPRTSAPEPEVPSFKRRGSGFRSPDAPPSGAADSEEKWSIGSRFQPSAPAEPASRFGSVRGRGEMGPPRDASGPTNDESDWRRPSASRNSTSPNSSVPPTPQMGRRKLELLPRSNTSATPSPLSSPNPAQAKPSPFGAAKPVDTVAKESAVAERLEKEREQVRERVTHNPMSRTSSHAGSSRGEVPPSRAPATASSPKASEAKPAAASAPAPNVRPSFSFASAAAGKKDAAEADAEAEAKVDEVADKVADLEV